MGEKPQVPRVLTPLHIGFTHTPEVLPTHLCFQDLDSSLPVFQGMVPRVWSHSLCPETEPAIDYHLVQRRGSRPGLGKGLHSGPLHLHSSISLSIQWVPRTTPFRSWASHRPIVPFEVPQSSSGDFYLCETDKRSKSAPGESSLCIGRTWQEE